MYARIIGLVQALDMGGFRFNPCPQVAVCPVNSGTICSSLYAKVDLVELKLRIIWLSAIYHNDWTDRCEQTVDPALRSNLIKVYTICYSVFIFESLWRFFMLKWFWLKIWGSHWATSWENLFLPYANKKGADQPAHRRSLISTFIVRCLDNVISLDSIAEISNL